MVRRDASGIWRSTLLEPATWLEHGFGGRNSIGWPPEHAAAARQVHGSDVLRAGTAGNCGEGDALVTDVPGLWVGVRTADCVPILLADQRSRRVAAVHAGWRGTVAQVVVKALEELGASPVDVWAAIGPAIGRCCYEVGSEVAREFGQPVDGNGRAHLDLVAENRQQLERAGVPGGQIDAEGPVCTRCHEDFHSFRRDGAAAGRQVSAIRLR